MVHHGGCMTVVHHGRCSLAGSQPIGRIRDPKHLNSHKGLQTIRQLQCSIGPSQGETSVLLPNKDVFYSDSRKSGRKQGVGAPLRWYQLTSTEPSCPIFCLLPNRNSSLVFYSVKTILIWKQNECQNTGLSPGAKFQSPVLFNTQGSNHHCLVESI